VIRHHGRQVQFVAADVTSQAPAEVWISEAAGRMGRIIILVSNVHRGSNIGHVEISSDDVLQLLSW
jgi:NAD(P)-dependent dehydrogenase (short-subunit alcohol dehydrogenase family)